MFAARVDRSTLEERLDASYYSPEFVANALTLRTCGLSFKPVLSVASKCNCGSTPKQIVYDGGGQGLIRTTDVRPDEFLLHGVLRSSDVRVSSTSSIAAQADDLLYTMSGTIGYAAVIPRTPDVFSFSNTIARTRVRPDVADARFIAAFFNCKYGYRQSLRLVSGGIQGHVMPNPFKQLPVPTPDVLAQQHVGAKVRQAEMLREWAGESRSRALEKIAGLTKVDVRQKPQVWQRLPAGGVSNRLDCNYYDSVAMLVERDLRSTVPMVPLGEVLTRGRTITNGVRGPDHALSKYRLVRLQDCVNWTIEYGGCLTISAEQFAANERCQLVPGDVLVAIGGYIGNAALVTSTIPAVIGQHSAVIPLEPGGRVVPAFLCAYLNSDVGAAQFKRYVSGTVQAGINLEDLREIEVPVPPLALQNHVADCALAFIRASVMARGLALAARMLVEAMIECRVTEAELVAASKDADADRALLSRLRDDGLDGTGEPLFPDLDALAELLAEAASSR